jgi:hypothetical protein
MGHEAKIHTGASSTLCQVALQTQEALSLYYNICKNAQALLRSQVTQLLAGTKMAVELLWSVSFIAAATAPELLCLLTSVCPGYLEACALTSACLLLHRHDLHDLILEGTAQEVLNNLVLLHWHGEQVNGLQRLDLALCINTAPRANANSVRGVGRGLYLVLLHKQ